MFIIYYFRHYILFTFLNDGYLCFLNRTETEVPHLLKFLICNTISVHTVSALTLNTSDYHLTVLIQNRFGTDSEQCINWTLFGYWINPGFCNYTRLVFLLLLKDFYYLLTIWNHFLLIPLPWRFTVTLTVQIRWCHSGFFYLLIWL